MGQPSTLGKSFELTDLDQMAILSERDPQRIAIKIGLICTLYVPRPHDPEVRHRLAACGDDYLRRFGAAIRLWQGPNGQGRMKAFPGGSGILSAHVHAHEDAGEPFTPSFTGATVARDAASHSMVITAPGTRYFSPGEISGSFTATIPVSVVLDRAVGDRVQRFQDLVQKWCEWLQPESGYAGLGFIQSVDWNERLRTLAQVSALAQRFPGLEVDNPEIIGNHVGGRIKGVNWLTIVSDPLLDAVGGRTALTSALPLQTIPVRDFGGGVVIQAGPAPQIGDVNRSDRLEPYRVVSRLLRPLRMQFPEEDALLDLGDGDESELTRRWLARFD